MKTDHEKYLKQQIKAIQRRNELLKRAEEELAKLEKSLTVFLENTASKLEKDC